MRRVGRYPPRDKRFDALLHRDVSLCNVAKNNGQA
jgi:hypothetical protein